MAKISDKQLVLAIKKAEKMDLKNKELVCETLFAEQPNLLASVLVLQQMDNSLEDVEVLLNILIVLHLAVIESGQKIAKVSEQVQERQLKLLTASVKFSEGMDNDSINRSIEQYISNQNQPVLLAYVLASMIDAGFYERQHDSSKYLIMAGINLVNCIAHATA